MAEGRAWTPTDDARLTELWMRGLSARQIVDNFPERTRNAIIGRVHRLGLQRKMHDSGTIAALQTKVPRKRSNPFKPRAKIVMLDHRMPFPAVPEGGVTLMDLRWYHCRSIISMNGSPEGLAVYCGQGVMEGKSFCSEHAALYYRPIEMRLRRRA